MKKTAKMIKREMKTKVLTKGFLIGTVLGPVFIIGLIFFPALMHFYSEEEQVVMHVVDQTGDLANRLPQVFDDTLSSGQPRYIITPLNFSTYERNKQNFHQSIEDGDIDVIIIIPDDVYESNSITHIAKSVSNIDFIRSIRQQLNAEINKIRLQRAGLDPDQIAKLTTNIELKTIKISKGEETEKGFGQEWGAALVFLMILYITTIVYGASVMRGVLEEKTSRVLEILLSSGNSFQLMMGKLLGVGTVGLVQYGIWAVVALGGMVVAGATSPSLLNYMTISPYILIYFILFFLIGYFQFSTLYAAVGAMCSTQEDAQALSTPVTILIIIPFLVTISLGIENPSASLTQILSLMPFFAPMLMFLRIIVSTPDFWQIAAAIAINIVAILLFTWLAARIYRVGILLYGKRPTVPEIVRWLRYR
ncbi:MAG: ABC transporter permease [Calditrichae bacterium]|nr:ABC transporter permease [Calditrichia bacterium]